MLKWAVYGKKNNENPSNRFDGERRLDYTNGPYAGRSARRSLDANSIKQSRKPARYQRRSLSSAATKKSNIKTVDKENVNYVGHTPNCYKEGFSTKKPDIANALKDVSNITPSAVTPTTPVYKKKPTDDGPRWYQGKSTDSVPSDLNGTPSTYSRKIREAKKRKLEMAAEVNTKDKIANEDCGLNTESPVASKEENNIKERLSIVVPQKTLSRSLTSSYILDKDTKNKHPVSTTNTAGDESVEIEYSSEEYVKYRREFPNAAPDKTTLPIFGSRILLENPLYFNNPELSESILPSKRTRKKSNEFESSFKSPSVDKNVHSLIREGFSPISITPLSNKLAALRFSTLRCHGHEKKVVTNNHFNSNFTKGPNAFSLSMMRDEEISTEMENKFIVPGEITSLETESVSDSQMGDMTLEKMIEDIIKSTKKVKSRRKMLQDKPNNVASRNKTLIKTDNKELVESHMFVKPCTENKNNLIREAKHVNLSRENSMSPKCSPKKIDNSKTNTPDFFLKLGISNNCNRSFILDDCTIYNEREVKTPENKLTIPPTIISIDNKTNEKIHVERSKSFSVVSSNRDKVVSADNKSSESTPNIPFDTQENSKYRLKRQKCVRRKKSTVSIEGSWKKRETKPSILTLEMGIPSPYLTEIDEISKYDPRSSSFNCITGPCNEEDSDIYIKRKPLRSNSTSSNVSHSSMLLNQSSPRKPCTCKPLFGLTLENGIPSPITPVANLKRTNSNLSEERLHKSCKLDAEYINAADGTTPLIEYKSSRRCLTFSPEDASFNSSEEKRRSVASNKSGRSVEHVHAVKGTIELSIICRNGVVDVHVIRCRDLQKTSGKTDDINAYTKVLISGTNEYQPFGTQRSVFQRTSVLYGRREPEFQRHLKLPLPGTIYDHLLIHVSVWHRDKKYRRSEFLGCVSFPLKDVIKSDVSGCYYLQSQVSAGRAPVAPDAHALQEAARESGRKRGVTAHGDMATDNMDGGNTNDSEKESASDKGIAANGTGGGGAGGGSGCAGAAGAHAALQREADEHLFLRYLELDPVEGTEGTPTPRRAGARQGRTPFTSTRRLLRTGTGGFGFTVVWTQPPRLERVAPGGPAERAGARPGDYLVFVGTKNVVTAPEEQVRQLVHSSGPTLILETFRRVAQNGLLPSAAIQRGSTASHLTSSDLDVITRPLEPLTETYMPSATVSAAPSAPSAAPSAPSGSTVRPGTACSAATSQSLDVTAARRKLHLPQVTFSKETPAMTHEQQRRRALLAVVAREQHYATCLQFGLGRFVAPLAERSDLITPADHQLLFQNIEEILRLSEDILDQVVHEDGEIQASTVVAVYLQKTPMFLSLYKKYCLGLKRADCVLVKKSRDPSGAFVRFCTSPPLPRRRPDITSLVHKPLEQFRELLRLMRTAAAAGVGNGANSTYEQYERKPLQAIADQLQHSYQEVTAGSGLMGLAGDGKPLLSVADLESRLVFTRCKPFVLGTPGRQWIFGGELSRVEGRTVKPYWALLFSDLLLFATVSRDRVLFITEEPVALATVSDACFNVRKKATEFRLTLGRAGGESPLVSCSPRALLRARSITLRTPSLDLKAVWQSLLQRQIYRVHTMSGTPLGSPLDSPDPQLTFSLATLDSQRQTQNRRNSAEAGGGGGPGGEGAGGRSKGTGRGASLHLAHWMTQLPEKEECEPPEQDLQTWSVEELRKRSKELNLIDVAGIIGDLSGKTTSPHDKNDNERSPSKSSSGSQITVRTSPVVVDTIPICRQCHKKCFSKPNSPLVSQKEQQVTSNVTKEQLSPKATKSNPCSAQCGNCHKSANFSKIPRKGAMKMLNPKDAPQAALRVIDSIEQYQKRLKSTSYRFGNDSPLLGSMSTSSDTKSPNINLERLSRLDNGNFIRSPSPCNSSRNNSPLSTSHTTCSSIVFNSSANDLRTSSPNMAATVQCVIAQEKYLNEVKCVENVVLSKNKNSMSPSTKDKITRKKAENVLSKVLGMNIITKRENVSGCLRSSSVFLDDDSMHEDENDFKSSPGKSSTLRRTSEIRRANGDVKKTEMKGDLNSTSKGSDVASDDDLEWGPLMLMGLSAINPAAHLMRVEPSALRRPRTLESNTTSTDLVPNISVVPPTPDYISVSKHENLLDDSPDSPQPEEPPYVTLKRYGTMSSLERMPSDETDDGNQRLNCPDNDTDQIFSTQASAAGYGAGGGLMGWTARAGSFVVEKMNIFSYTETTPLPMVVANHKQPSFLERYLGVSEWRGGSAPDEPGVGDGGEGSGASGEEAWGTPSSGDLSDSAFPDSDHGTLSSPTKSSSSYAGDDDTELMMDELLMAPTIAGPTLRPLLPRRRLEPLMEEEYSDSGSEDIKVAPVPADDQGSTGRGLVADDCCAAPRRTGSAYALEVGSEPGGRGAGAEWVAARGGGGATLLSERSPDTTPTNEQPSPRSRSASKDSLEARWGAAGGAAGAGGGAGAAGRRGSGSSASTPSTLERTAIHNPSPSHQENQTESEPEPEAPPPATERLSPRAEMRLALDQGKDMLVGQDDQWSRGGGSDHWSWRAACQRSLLRRVASADAVTLCRPLRGPQPQPHQHPHPHPHPFHRTALDTTSHSSAYAWKESDKLHELMEMEQLAQVEVQTMRSRTRSQCQNGKILGFLRRRASSDSPRRTELASLTSARPFSPRRTTEKQFEKRFWSQLTRRQRSCSTGSQV